jgi:F0F1-type ATP synthase membrane subunit c/vacuolar-type H+-ATPase subunit K
MSTMDSSLKLLRIVWAALLMAIAGYIVIGERVPSSRPSANPLIFRAIALAAISTVVIIFVVRRVIVTRATQTLGSNPGDQSAFLRWRGGSIAIFALCEAIALYGFVLRMQGFTLSQVAPFYISGLLLMVYFGPRRPASNAISASASATR